MKIAEVLDKAADLIEPEGAWTQGSWALDANGNQVGETDPAATCFCAVGAINRIMGVNSWAGQASAHPLATPVRKAFERVAGSYPMPFNDSHPHAEVVAKLREAAAKAREQSS